MKILSKNSQIIHNSGIAGEPQLSDAGGGRTPEDSQHPVQLARRHSKSGIFWIDRISNLAMDLAYKSMEGALKCIFYAGKSCP